TFVFQNGCDGQIGSYAGTGSGSLDTWGCGAKATDLYYGGLVSAATWGSAGGGYYTGGASDSPYGTGGGQYSGGAFNGGTSAGSCGYAEGGFGGGGSGNGCQ